MRFQPDGVDIDEASRICGIKTTLNIHTGKILIVERIRRIAANGHNIALVQRQAHFTVSRQSNSDKIA